MTVSPQSYLDALMEKVLARRDENWKKLKQYILEERVRVEVLGANSARLWGEERDYQWFLVDGFFVRSGDVLSAAIGIPIGSEGAVAATCRSSRLLAPRGRPPRVTSRTVSRIA